MKNMEAVRVKKNQVFINKQQTNQRVQKHELTEVTCRGCWDTLLSKVLPLLGPLSEETLKHLL